MYSNQKIRIGRPVDGLLNPDSIRMATTLARNTGVTLTWDVVRSITGSPITEVHGFGDDEEIVVALMDVLTMHLISDQEGR